MRRAGLVAGFLVVLAMSTAVRADDAHTNTHDIGTLPDSSATIDALLAASKYDRRWQLALSAEPVVEEVTWTSNMPEVYFQDTGTIARISRLRALSLLTLLENGKSRMFLGVNDRGVVGLHFGAFSHTETGETLEVLRMPYLEAGTPAGD